MSEALSREEAVAREIAGHAELDRAALVLRWEAAYGLPPPHKLSRVLIEKGLAYDIQCRAFGGLSATTRRALEAAAGKGKAPARRPGSGARLVREWNGRTHEVEVTEGGFRWQGRSWRSLSAIARAITGTNWSGPRFFGIEKRP